MRLRPTRHQATYNSRSQMPRHFKYMRRKRAIGCGQRGRKPIRVCVGAVRVEFSHSYSHRDHTSGRSSSLRIVDQSPCRTANAALTFSLDSSVPSTACGENHILIFLTTRALYAWSADEGGWGNTSHGTNVAAPPIRISLPHPRCDWEHALVHDRFGKRRLELGSELAWPDRDRYLRGRKIIQTL